ncbi:hypothetical protein FQA39_LY03663 [Lamprigera yunnana]|nr:hypothetical protein FQA39_LY03663 [Lamprigera yunnana]
MYKNWIFIIQRKLTSVTVTLFLSDLPIPVPAPVKETELCSAFRTNKIKTGRWLQINCNVSDSFVNVVRIAPVNTGDLISAIVQGLCASSGYDFGMGLELKLPVMCHLKGFSKFRQEEMKRESSGVYSKQLQRSTSGILFSTPVATKTDKNGLIEAECACIRNSLRPSVLVVTTKSCPDCINGFKAKVMGNKSGASSELALSVKESD